MVKGATPRGVDELRRGYDSTRRREGARATASAVLDAARDLFVERGYVGTTIAAIASQAGVSAETVYSTFTNKRSLLARLLDRSIAGDDEPVPILERGWVATLRREPDMAARARILAREGAAILARRSPIDRVLRDAAAADPAIAEMWRTSKARRLEGQQRMVRLVIGPNDTRSDAHVDELADTLFAIGSPECYQLLVVDRDWSHGRFASWYEVMLTRLFLDRPARV